MNIGRIYSDGKLYAEPIFLPSAAKIFECRIDDSCSSSRRSPCWRLWIRVHPNKRKLPNSAWVWTHARIGRRRQTVQLVWVQHPNDRVFLLQRKMQSDKGALGPVK